MKNPMVDLVNAETPEEIERLENIVGRTQAEMVDSFIEDTCWSEDLPEYIGGRGTAEERLEGLRFVMRLPADIKQAGNLRPQ